MRTNDFKMWMSLIVTAFVFITIGMIVGVKIVENKPNYQTGYQASYIEPAHTELMAINYCASVGYGRVYQPDPDNDNGKQIVNCDWNNRLGTGSMPSWQQVKDVINKNCTWLGYKYQDDTMWYSGLPTTKRYTYLDDLANVDNMNMYDIFYCKGLNTGM